VRVGKYLEMVRACKYLHLVVRSVVPGCVGVPQLANLEHHLLHVVAVGANLKLAHLICPKHAIIHTVGSNARDLINAKYAYQTCLSYGFLCTWSD
jgi:hypothetical protein